MKKIVSIMVILISLIAYTNVNAFGATEFPDMKGHWAAESVKILTDKNIIAGWGGLFHPNDQVKANEYVKMVVTAPWLYGYPKLSGRLGKKLHRKSSRVGTYF